MMLEQFIFKVKKAKKSSKCAGLQFQLKKWG